jgi:O-antigen/teichoic acid export membrane protein
MIQSRFFRNVSFNTFQLIINQLFGLLIFYGLSKGLDKNIFGQINWSLAVLLTVFGILTLGIDQVMVKKIAAGYNRQSIFSIYLFHVIISGGVFYIVLLLFYFLLPYDLFLVTSLLFIGLGKLGVFISSPFKQLASGLEKFRELFLMSVTSNVIRGFLIFILLLVHKLSVSNVFIIFVLGDLSELALCIFIARPLLESSFKLRFNKRRHFSLIKESLPQTGVVLFTAIMSRFDWILIGVLVSSIKLAEYSFAYKIFEVSTLPLLIIAPIMIPLFTRLHKSSENMNNISFFLEWQMIIASFIALLLNICWIPLVDFISDGKYGIVNSGTIFLLSLSMPLLYFTNYLWTINFTKGNLKLIFIVMAASFAVNITSCCILIPIYKNEGAAMAYLFTIITQLIFYIWKKTLIVPKTRGYFLLWPVTTILIALVVYFFTSHTIVRISIATILYLTTVLISKQASLKNWKNLHSLYQ